jgi:hypothetical protein
MSGSVEDLNDNVWRWAVHNLCTAGGGVRGDSSPMHAAAGWRQLVKTAVRDAT